jgi:hypothetical protein
VVSVYADGERTADYVRRHYAAEIACGALRVIDTPARIFNKARAVNIAVAAVSSPYVLLIDCDCELTSSTALSGIVNHYNAHRYELASFSYQGQIMVRRDKFVELGGFDGSLRDGWCPDDADFIARYVAYYGEPYIQLGRLKYTRIITLRNDRVRVVLHQSKNRRWINQIENRRPEVTDEVIYDNRFFHRIGGWHNQSHNSVLESQIRYFLQHSPRVPYLTHVPQSN